MTRQPAVAGRFYPDHPKSLREDVKSHIDEGAQKTTAMGVVCPHAGFMYSGDVAGSVYSRIEIPDTVIILGPNHTGMGKRISLMTEGTWSMPFGELEVDAELANAVLAMSPDIFDNASAHGAEHSLETQLPFLQYFKKDFRIVPICIMNLDLKECRALSESIFKAVKKVGRRVLIVASSDMSHYESHDEASAKDHKAIDQILKMDPEGLYETVQENSISMCGVVPATVMLMVSKEMGARQAELVKYMTSGETSGDYDRVVGYAGMIVK